MAAMTEDEQMAAAIAASLQMNNPPQTAASTTPVPVVSTSASTTTTAAASSSSSGENKEDSASPAPAKKTGKPSKPKILRFVHKNGLHRMANVLFDMVKLKDLKRRLITDMNLRIDPKDIVLKMNKEAAVAWGSDWDQQTITELGISKNGHKLWLEFPEPKLLPLWTKLGTRFIAGGDRDIGPERLASAEIIGIYFSAHWCPPCRQFTPKLVKTYNAMKSRGAPIEILFISADKSKEEFDSYFASMPWIAHPNAADCGLDREFGVSGLPSLIFIKTDGTVITQDGRALVDRDPSGGAIMKAAVL